MPAGLEIFFLDEAGQAGAQQQGSSPPSVFYAFASQDERESAIAALTAQAKLGAGVPGGHDSAVARAGLLEVCCTSQLNYTDAPLTGFICRAAELCQLIESDI